MRKRHKPEQIVRKLREADALLSGGATIADACRRLEVREATYHRWRKQYSGMEIQALEASEGCGAGEHTPEEDRGRSGGGHQHPEGGR